MTELKESAVNNEATPLVSGTMRTLLLVDDESNIVASLRRLLRGAQYNILVANSGKEGLALLAKNKVGVIISDQRMPEMTGVEFLSQVKELYPDTVRIVLSGYADIDSLTDAINRGAIYKFLTKPWNGELLCASVAQAFDHYELAQARAAELLASGTMRTLLLVDDEANIVSALRRLLIGNQYNILVANSAKEGLALLEQNKVGVVVSDQRMPGMTGVEFLIQVKELYPDTVRIVLSGYADIDLVTDAINRGAIYKFLTKPWSDELLCANVAEAFVHYKLVQEEIRLTRDIQMAHEQMAHINRELEGLVAHKDSQIERIAHYDPLTSLPNRALFLDRLEQEMARAQRDGSLVAVMSIDLDHFKQINDSFGHPVGDKLLQLVAQRLESFAQVGDTVARMGGDEFSFVLTSMKGVQEAGAVAQKILDSFACDPISIGDSDVFVAASIGISIYPLDGVDTTTLIKNADAALYHAKSEGRNNFQYYATQMNAMAWQHLSLKTELHRALEREEFVLYYQPKVDLASGKIIGMEALLRWQSPARGLVSPGEFIPLLEETGLILPVGEWILREASKQVRAWQKIGFQDINIAVNVSALQFRQPDFSGVLLDIFQKSGLDPGIGALELELTESLLMNNVEVTVDTLNKLHEIGIQLSIDDFGTGYSSLSYLKRFPISSLKIDQSFVRDLASNKDDAAIVTAIIALGHSLGLKVIAEGVETVEQLTFLRKMKCDQMQGYLFSRPLPAAEMTRLLQSGKTLELSLKE